MTIEKTISCESGDVDVTDKTMTRATVSKTENVGTLCPECGSKNISDIANQPDTNELPSDGAGGVRGSVDNNNQFTVNPEVNNLLQHMMNYNGGFGSREETMVLNAMASLRESFSDSLILICYLAARFANTQDEYANCRKFVDDYTECCWRYSMTENANTIHTKRGRPVKGT